ncbi:Putative ATP-dependent DNA helicase yjcD [uncultured Clostridium sp.]|nr:Putative ATP-dependent DNA helicase yjcD [uncultured Clostridium sp.]
MDFNQAQMTALEHRDGPMMVLAGPGSGKTTVITHRIKRLLEAGVDPSGILVITFTKAAATEMKERFLRLAREEDEKRKQAEQRAGGSRTGAEKPFFGTADPGPRRREACGTSLEAAGSRVSFGTFHSVFYHILKWAYRFPAGNVISGEEKRQYFKKFLDESEMEVEDEAEFISSIINEISYVKGERLDLKYYYSQNCPEEWFKKLYDGYDEMLKTTGKIDFDDMLVMCHELFTERKDILAAWQKKFKYILVDEFQDINLLQYQVVRMLALPENNLFIVGDDDQSIYRFRGAKPEIMLGFEKDFPGTKRVLLGTNYRSTKEIVETSLRLIEHNKVRFDKKLEPFRGSGRPVDFRVFDNPGHEMDTVAQSIRAYHDAGYQWSEIAVLFRTGANSGLMAERLMGYNIPFKLRDVIPNLYSHWIAKDLFAYMEIAAGSRKRSDFYRIMNRPNRYFSRDAFDTPIVSFDRLKSFYQDRDWMEKRICDLEADLRAMAPLKPVAAVNYIRKAIGYDDYLRSYAEFRRMKPEELFETADKLAESAAEFATFVEWKEHAARYEEELKKQNQEEREETKDRVTLSTMHSAKGLEYPVVFVVDANEGIVPHHKAGLPADIEEERRLFYVALTRAKDRLHVAAVKERYHRKTDVSRFVEEAGL